MTDRIASSRGTWIAFAVLLAGSVLGPTTSLAQQRVPPPAASVLLRGRPPAAPTEPASPHPRTYRTEGAIIGGVLLGGGLLVLGLAFDDPDGGGSVNVPVVTLIGATLGTFTGMMIGGLFPKGPPRSEAPDSKVPALRTETTSHEDAKIRSCHCSHFTPSWLRVRPYMPA
jgi:hypothetical protein